jgi:hypothetical protein
MAVGTILAGAAIGFDAFNQIRAGRAAKRAATSNAETALNVGNENADLILEGADLNAGVDEFNARVYEGQATDAVARGKDTENRFRQQIKGLIGSQRASYAAQGIDVSDGSALDVQMDTARQGQLDALTIRTNAAREAWGFNVQAKGFRLQADNTRKLGKLQATNTRTVARAQAKNYLAGGNYAAAAANWGAASTILTGAANLAMTQKYGGRS